MAKLPTSDDIKNRIRDELAGVKEGRSSLNVGEPKGKAEHIPTVQELGLPSRVRRELDTLTGAHEEDARSILGLMDSIKMGHVWLGKIEKMIKGQKETRSFDIKHIWKEEIGDETSKLYVGVFKCSTYWQNRSSFSQTVARTELLNSGVRPDIIDRAFKAATTPNRIWSLRVTPPGEDDE